MEILRELYKKYREGIMYLIFGGMTTLVNWLTYGLLTRIGDGIDKILAEIIAWTASVLFAFFTNKFFVFVQKDNSRFLKEILAFFGARALSGLFEIGGFALLVGVFKFNDVIANLGISGFDLNRQKTICFVLGAAIFFKYCGDLTFAVTLYVNCDYVVK